MIAFIANLIFFYFFFDKMKENILPKNVIGIFNNSTNIFDLN